MATATQPLSGAQLQALWIQAGGDPAQAQTAAAIALAESSGIPSQDVSDPSASDPNARSYGLWQINSPNFAGLQSAGVPITAANATDPLTNAKAAVALYNAKGGSFTDWSTYTGWTPNGFVTPPYLSEMAAAAQGTTNAIGAAYTAVTGSSSPSAPATTATAANPLGDDPTGLKTALAGDLTNAENTVGGWLQTSTVVAIGLALLAGGFTLAAANNKTVQNVTEVAAKTA